MGIGSASEYVDFFLKLGMGDGVTLISFVNNERRVLKQKLGNRSIPEDQVRRGITILEQLADEIGRMGQDRVIEKYKGQDAGQ